MNLRGASAESYTALRAQVDDLTVSAAAQVGNDLTAVAQLLRTEAGLRRVIADQTTEGAAKAELFRGLLVGKVEAATADLVADAVSRRWTTARDLTKTLEELGVVALARSAGEDSERLADELFAFTEVITQEHALHDALSDPVRSVADKATLVRSLLEGKALSATVDLAVHALSGSYRTATGALEAYQRIVTEAQGRTVSRVRVAQDLTETERTRLASALAQQYGRPVHLNVIVDPAVIGGMRVEIGDDVIEGSLSARLDDARRRLAG